MLNGKVALVTGGSRGIGREIALTLASYGATVIINYCGSKEKAEEVLELIQSNGGRASLYQGNIKDAKVVKEMFSTILSEYKKIDILVNNAGITRDNLIIKMSEEEWDEVIDVNLKGMFLCLQQASTVMLKQRNGSIINISSISGITGNPGQINYSAAKAGVIGMTKTLAKEIGKRGIRVNAIAPGYINTDMTAVLKDDLKEQISNLVPLKRLGECKDIAEMVAFIASDKASYITGQVIQIDGGLSI